MTWYISFHASGDHFQPSMVGYEFAFYVEPGTLATSGRYKGCPLPYGKAEIIAPHEITNPSEQLLAVCRLASELLPALRNAGATNFYLHVLREYTAQCNEELTTEEMKLIASLDCPFTYTAYQKEP